MQSWPPPTVPPGTQTLASAPTSGNPPGTASATPATEPYASASKRPAQYHCSDWVDT